eukprot:UN14269
MNYFSLNLKLPIVISYGISKSYSILPLKSCICKLSKTSNGNFSLVLALIAWQFCRHFESTCAILSIV